MYRNRIVRHSGVTVYVRLGAMALLLLGWLIGLGGCTAVNTFPMAARSGDTISVMIGGSELARKETIGAVLTDASGGQHDLQALGLVRSVFNLRPDGRAEGLHYSDYLDTYISWFFGHEPVQTVLVADLPTGLPPGIATLAVNLNASDNSSGIGDPARIKLEVLSGAGAADSFLRKTTQGPTPADLLALEPAPYAKLTFPAGAIIGAADLVIDVDQSAVNLDDLNVYVPESTVRGSVGDPGAFGDKQRMVYWHHDTNRLYIDIVAPQGIDGRFLMLYVMHPRDLPASPNFALNSATVYDLNGQPQSIQPVLTYMPN